MIVKRRSFNPHGSGYISHADGIISPLRKQFLSFGKDLLSSVLLFHNPPSTNYH